MTQAEAQTKTVLLIDDDVDFLTQEKIHIDAAGFKTMTADSRKQAMEVLETQRPDLVVVDVMMEETDAGFMLCYQIKKKDPTIPVIVVSSVSSESGMAFDVTTEEERSWIKADAFLPKPIRFEQLLKEIDRLLKA